jgi:hypothetical protein
MHLFVLLVLLLFQTPQQQNEHISTDHHEQAGNYDPMTDVLYRRYLAATIVGVIGGCVGIGVLIYQAVLTRRSADAAKQSADALMNAERPWILVSSSSLTSESITHSDDEPEVGPRRHFVVTFTIINVGRTPAMIQGVGGGVDVVEDLRHPSRSPEYSYKGQLRRVLGAGQEDTVQFLSQESFADDETITIYQGQSVKRRLLAYGVIEYTDSFGAKHGSNFCFLYKDMMYGFRYFCHDPAHNNYT